MLSAPSSSRDASLPSNTSASSSTSGSGATGTPAAPFDSVLAGLTPAQNGSPSQGSAAKATGSKTPAKPDPAASGTPGGATTAGGQVWSAPTNWLNAPAAPLTDGEAPADGDGEEPVAASDEEADADPSNILPITLPPALPPQPTPAAETPANQPTPAGNGETNTAASGVRRDSVAFEEDMQGALPDSPGALYSGAAARGETDVTTRAVNSRPGTGKGRNAGANEVAGAYAASPAASPKDAAMDPEAVAAATEALASSSSGIDTASGMSPVSGDGAEEPKIHTHIRAREGRGVFPPGVSPTTAPEHAAPFAAQANEVRSEQAEPEAPRLENIVQHIATEVVNPALKALGIDPAKVGSTMEIVAADPSALTPDMTASQADAEIAAASTSAFDRVLQVVDAARPNERSAVNVRLDFGDAGPLNVHITMRDGRVHTMFRCDSPELRDTLANAWSHFVQKGDTAALPLAEPVMLPLRASASSQDGGRQHENFHQPQSDGQPGRHAEAREDARAGSQGRPTRRQAAASIITPAASASPRGDSSSHLSVLA